MTAVEPMDVSSLSPTQYLLLDVLAARWRTGEHLWTFPTRPDIVRAAHRLGQLGLVGVKGGVEPKTIQVWLTEVGEAAVLLDGHENPADEARRLLVQHLRQATNHVDGRPLLWPDGLGPEPSWFDAYAVLADPVLSEQYGLTEQETAL